MTNIAPGSRMKWRCGEKQLRDGGRERGKKERKRDREGVSEGGRERERERGGVDCGWGPGPGQQG